MWDKEVYELDVAQHERMVAEENVMALIDWNERKTNWLRDSDRARSLKTPESQWPEKPVPAWKKTVVAPPFAPGPYDIVTHSGPERIADPTLILLPVPTFAAAAYPPGVVAVGNRTPDGGYWTALPEDTIPNGATITHQGRRLEKVEGFWPFGRKSFYYDRGAAA